MIKTLFAVLVIPLAGCVAIEYEPVTTDSPAPANAASIGPCPKKLEPGESCIAQIHANEWMSPTGIEVGRQGETYLVTVAPEQVWFDKGRRNTAPDGEKGSWIMRLPERRHDAPFFSLMIAVDPCGKNEGKNDAKVVDKQNGFQFVSDAIGKLVLYPNDAKGPVSDPAYWYKNNSGYIWVTIQRSKLDTSQPDSKVQCANN